MRAVQAPEPLSRPLRDACSLRLPACPLAIAPRSCRRAAVTPCTLRGLAAAVAAAAVEMQLTSCQTLEIEGGGGTVEVSEGGFGGVEVAIGLHWTSARLASATEAAHHGHGGTADLAPDAGGVGVQQRAGHAHPVEDGEVRLRCGARISRVTVR